MEVINLKYKNISRFIYITIGLILWAVIEHFNFGSFAYIFSAALILFPFERIFKEAVINTYSQQ